MQGVRSPIGTVTEPPTEEAVLKLKLERHLERNYVELGPAALQNRER